MALSINMAHVAGKRGHVVCGVGQGQHLLADEVADVLAADVGVETFGGDDGELLQAVTALSNLWMVRHCHIPLEI